MLSTHRLKLKSFIQSVCVEMHIVQFNFSSAITKSFSFHRKSISNRFKQKLLSGCYEEMWSKWKELKIGFLLLIYFGRYKCHCVFHPMKRRKKKIKIRLWWRAHLFSPNHIWLVKYFAYNECYMFVSSCMYVARIYVTRPKIK